MGRFDAVIVGGGPAGLAASIAAARAGLSVLVADVRKPPIDKLCGEGILPDGLASLAELGVDLNGQGLPFAGISFHDGRSSFAAAFPGKSGLGLRRTALHEALVAAALREGVTLRWQERAELQSADQVKVGGERIRCRYVIGADGQRSLVRQAAGLSGPSSGLRGKQRLATGRHYACAGWSRFVGVHWAGRTQAYVTPVGKSEVGVAFISADPAFRADSCLELFSELKERLEGAAILGREQGGTSIMLRVPHVVSGNVALIGEASGCVDAITGEGISLVFRQAIALGAALRAGELGQYQREHRRVVRRARLMSRMLMSLSEFPRWRARVFQAFAAEPRVFESLLAVHVGAWPVWLKAQNGNQTELSADLCGRLPAKP